MPRNHIRPSETREHEKKGNARLLRILSKRKLGHETAVQVHFPDGSKSEIVYVASSFEDADVLHVIQYDDGSLNFTYHPGENE
ncbi:hypothetical protein SEA_GUEY18_145 [Gordonia phage Guey18]|nr:hypothetical protein SEA_GUEY18_145 [Gordonia phage Guey18]